MADLSHSRTNRKHSSFATKHFQRRSLKLFDLHPPLERLLSFVARIITFKVRCWVTDTHTHRQTHRTSTVTLAAHARQGLMKGGVDMCMGMGPCMGQYDNRSCGMFSLSVTWFMGPRNRFPCPNTHASENCFAASKSTVVCRNIAKFHTHHPLLNWWTSWNRLRLSGSTSTASAHFATL